VHREGTLPRKHACVVVEYTRVLLWNVYADYNTMLHSATRCVAVQHSVLQILHCCLYTYIYMYIFIYIYMHINKYICIYMFMYIHICTCIYIHIYTLCICIYLFSIFKIGKKYEPKPYFFISGPALQINSMLAIFPYFWPYPESNYLYI